MKNKSFLGALLLLSVWSLLTASLRDPNNPPTGRTGAPNETTCGAAGCHTGGTYTGTVVLSGIPDTVVPNQSYTITLTHTSNASRAGFELTCLDGSNLKCGTLTNGSGTSTATSASRQYIRQASPKTLVDSTTSWTFTWKAPAVAAGNKATFYFVSLAANGNGERTGDNVLQATKTVAVLNPSVATNEATATQWVKLYPTVVQDELQVQLLDSNTGTLEIFDQQGRLALHTNLSALNTISVRDLPKGLYLARIGAKGKLVTQKFVVP